MQLETTAPFDVKVTLEGHINQCFFNLASALQPACGLTGVRGTSDRPSEF